MLLKPKYKILIFSLLACLLLCGCTKSVEFSGGKVAEDESHITMVLQEGETALLDSLPALKSADFSGSACIDEIRRWAQTNPQVDVTYTVTFPNGLTVDNRCDSIDLSGLAPADIPVALELASHLPLRFVELGEGGFTPDDLRCLAEAAPGVSFDYSFTLAGCGVNLACSDVILRNANSADLQTLTAYLPFMPNLKSVDLGSQSENSFSWDDIYALQMACPEAVLSYSFELYGQKFSLSDSSMNFSHVKMSDEGALIKKVTACMPNLSYLDMDNCGVSCEAMAEIRDALPNTEVVWRVWFGDAYSVRTNVDTILASNPGLGGELTPENTQELKYCTKVKYLDLGHNSYMSDISFVSYMPDLEVLIIAMADWTDISPLADCPKLEYAEIQTSGLHDLSPLAGLTNLRHLNICYCFVLHDMTPIMDLELERLWIGKLTPIPPEQVEEYRRRHPDCEVNDTCTDPTSESWRYVDYNEYAPRYGELRDQFDYGSSPKCYSYSWNDPLYLG